MSYFDDASLVMIPSGYKTSKVYSVKPTDGSGDLTFSRSNDTATRVNSAGLIEKVRTNLILQSQAFNTTWGAVSLTVSANTTANPLNGTVDADTFTLTGATTQKFIAQAFALNGTYTASAYLKAGTHQFIQFMLGTDAAVFANFNISAGSVGTSGGCTASIISVGNGWYRCVMTFSSTTGDNVFMLAADSASAARFSTTSSTGTFIAFGYQLELSDFGATDYIATTSAAVSVGPVANVPRLDYLNSSCPRLLLEPQRTNLFAYSEQLDNAYWSKIGAITVTANNAVSPDGYQNADLVTGAGGGARIQRTFSGLTAGTRTLSCFVKAGTGTGVIINSYDGIVDKSAIFNVATGVVDSTSAGVSATITNYGNGWYRLTHTYTSAGTSYSCQFFFDDGLTYRVWGMQFEDSAAYATSYIPTLGAAVTRGADSTYEESSSALIGQTEGTLFAQFKGADIAGGGASRLSISSGTSANWVFVGTESDSLRAYVRANSSVIFSDTSVPQTGNDKIAIAYKSGSIALYINGVQIATSSSTFTFSATLDDITTGVGGVYSVDETLALEQFIIFPTRLSNSDLAALTA